MDEFYLLLPEASKTFATIVPENQEQKSFYLENEQTHSSSLPMVMSMDVPFWFLPRCRREAGGEEGKELPSGFSVALSHQGVLSRDGLESRRISSLPHQRPPNLVNLVGSFC